MTILNIRDIGVLQSLRSAFGRFGGETTSALQAADMEIQRNLEWLQERLHHWQREVERCRQEVQRAQAALSRCQQSGCRDEDGHYQPPSCSVEEAALARAQQRLADAEYELQNTRCWLQQVEQAEAEYRVHAGRLHSLATTQNDRACAYLAAVHAELERVVADGKALTRTDAAFLDRLMTRMSSKTVDLSTPTENGKLQHALEEGQLEAAFPGQAASEVHVRVTLADGSYKTGRIDTLLGSTIVDYKTHDLGRLNENGRLDHELDRIADQVNGYRDSPDVPPGAVGIIKFTSPPADPACRQHIEEYLLGKGSIQVVWGDW